MANIYAKLARRYGTTIDRLTRRQMLKATAAGAAGLLLSRLPGCGRAKGPQPHAVRPHGRRVTIIGAGFAGLACAYELKAAAYDIIVVDARKRVGGRVLSFGDFVPGKNVEGGGELIGSNHPTWAAYAERFGLEFLDVTEDETLAAPILLEGRKLDHQQAEGLWEAMDAAFGTLNQDAARVNADEPWKTPRAEELDRKTMQEWLDGLDLEPLNRRAIAALLASDNGVPLARQSYLGMLAQVAGGGGEKYWTESEVYRCRGGNQQLAVRLAEAVGGERVLLNLPATHVGIGARDCAVRIADGRVLESDDVVLAVPPSTWGKIRISPPLPERLRPQMGVNVKYLAAVRQRFWKPAGLAPDSLSDGPVSQTWDGTDNQPGEGAAMVCFSGAEAAEQCLQFTADSRDAAYQAALGGMYPGFSENFIGSRFMDWPQDPWTLTGYSFPAPGQVTGIGPMLHGGLGRLHFCGEHTCYKFVGFMEGALSSGVALARRLAAAQGVAAADPPDRGPAARPGAASAVTAGRPGGERVKS